MDSKEKIREIEKTLDETADKFIISFNKIQRLIQSIKQEE